MKSGDYGNYLFFSHIKKIYIYRFPVQKTALLFTDGSSAICEVYSISENFHDYVAIYFVKIRWFSFM